MQYKFKAVLSYKCVFIYKHACLHACIHMHICICTFVVALIAKSCPTLFRPRGLKPLRLLCPLDCPGKNTRGSCHALLQGIFLTQGLNPCLLHWIIYHWITRETYICTYQIRSDQISCSVMSDSLRPHELQQAGPSCPSPTPRVHWDVHRVSDAIHIYKTKYLHIHYIYVHMNTI